MRAIVGGLGAALAAMTICCVVIVGGLMAISYVVLWAVSFLPDTAQGFIVLAIKVGLGVVLFLACGAFGMMPPRKGHHDDYL